MYSVAVWGLSITVVVDCATAGRLFPWLAIGFLVRGVINLLGDLTR
jgi:hypothetical protein